MKNYDNDVLYSELADLVNSDYRKWYLKAFYIVGKDEVLRLASVARADGKNKSKYFSVLLKQAMQKSAA